MESLARGLGQSHINPGSAAHQETDLIHSVQRQSHDLARYKESCRTLQEQLNLQREKHRLYRMDVELTIQTMQQRIHQLESIERQLREENTKLSTNPPPMLQKHIDERIEKLEAQITAYRVDADRQRQLRSQIEEELKNVTSTSKMSIADSKRREDSLNSMINQFKEQVNRIQDQYQEKDNALRSSQMLMTRQHQELEERIHELNQRSETIRRLEREKSDLLHSMSALQGRVDQLRVSLQAALGSGVRNEDVSMAVVHHDLSRILDLHHREESQYASLIAHQQDTIEKLQTEISELQRKHEDSIAAHAYSSLPPPPSPDPLALANVDKLVHFIRILEETFGEVLQGDKLREKDFIRASHFGGELEVELHEVRSTFVSHLRKVEELCSHRHELHQRVSHYENSLPVESKKVHELSAKLESHEEEKKRLIDRIHELQQTLQSRNGMIGDLCTQLFESNVKMGISAKPPPPSSAMAVLFSSIDPEHVPWSVVYKALTEQVYLNSKSVVSRQDRFAKSPPHAKSSIRSKVITAQSYESEDDTSVYSEETMTSHHTRLQHAKPFDRSQSPLRSASQRIRATNEALTRTMQSVLKPHRSLSPPHTAKSRDGFQTPATTPVVSLRTHTKTVMDDSIDGKSKSKSKVQSKSESKTKSQSEFKSQSKSKVKNGHESFRPSFANRSKESPIHHHSKIGSIANRGSSDDETSSETSSTES